MLELVVRCALAAVLAAAAAAKVARPSETRAALGGLLRGAGAQPLPLAAWAALVAGEAALAGGVAAGVDHAAIAAALLMSAAAAVVARALRAGRTGAPCGCFGARSRVGRLAVVRALALAAGFAAVPLLPEGRLAAQTWLALGLGMSLAGMAVLAVCVLALAREVGMLRLAIGPQSALEIPEEGPPLMADSGLGPHLDPRVRTSDDVLALAVFTSDGCRLCRALGPAMELLGRDPHVSLLELDEVRDADHWRRLGVPGSPYALALDGDGQVLAKGTFNSLAQLESVLGTAERRRREAAGV